MPKPIKLLETESRISEKFISHLIIMQFANNLILLKQTNIKIQIQITNNFKIT